jgi:hypothetical protein
LAVFIEISSIVYSYPPIAPRGARSLRRTVRKRSAIRRAEFAERDEAQDLEGIDYEETKELI